MPRIQNFAGEDKQTEMTFTSDGRFFACTSAGLGLYVWKYTPAGYELHQRFIFTFFATRVSPQMESQSSRRVIRQRICGPRRTRSIPRSVFRASILICPNLFWNFPQMKS